MTNRKAGGRGLTSSAEVNDVVGVMSTVLVTTIWLVTETFKTSVVE
jgi:hypothetical protein